MNCETVEAWLNTCVPVINALSEVEHPCRALADYFLCRKDLAA